MQFRIQFLSEMESALQSYVASKVNVLQKKGIETFILNLGARFTL